MTSTPINSDIPPIHSHTNITQTSANPIPPISAQTSNQPTSGIQPNGRLSTTEEGTYPSSPAGTGRAVPQIKLAPSPTISHSPISTPRSISGQTKPIPKPTAPSFPAPRSPLAQGTTGTSNQNGNTSTSVVPTASARGFPGQVDAVAGPSTSRLEQEAHGRKRKWDTQGYSQMEQNHLEQRSNELHLALLLDQEETVNASAKRFTSYKDMVDRLLPWHVWQIHDEELRLGSRGRGKGAEDVEAAEIAEAAGLVARVKRIQERFGKARRREGNPNRPSFDILSLINMTKDSTTLARADLPYLQSRQSALENSLQGIQEQAQRKEAEERRAEEERVKQIRKAQAAEEDRKRAEFNLALAAQKREREARQAEEERARVVKEKEDKARQVAERASRGRGRPRGRGRGRGAGQAAGLREAVLTQQTTSTPSSPVPVVSAGPATPSPQPLATIPGTPAPSTPARTNGNPATPSAVGNNCHPHPSTAHLGTITLLVKLNVLPQLVKLGLITIPQPTDEQAQNAYPAVIKGPVPGSTTGDLYLRVRLNMCSPFQMHGLAKALNIAIPASAYRDLANSGLNPPSAPSTPTPSSPAPLSTPVSVPAPASTAIAASPTPSGAPAATTPAVAPTRTPNPSMNVVDGGSGG